MYLQKDYINFTVQQPKTSTALHTYSVESDERWKVVYLVWAHQVRFSEPKVVQRETWKKLFSKKIGIFSYFFQLKSDSAHWFHKTEVQKKLLGLHGEIWGQNMEFRKLLKNSINKRDVMNLSCCHKIQIKFILHYIINNNWPYGIKKSGFIK